MVFFPFSGQLTIDPIGQKSDAIPVIYLALLVCLYRRKDQGLPGNKTKKKTSNKLFQEGHDKKFYAIESKEQFTRIRI